MGVEREGRIQRGREGVAEKISLRGDIFSKRQRR